jgi:hypothetical protein
MNLFRWILVVTQLSSTDKFQATVNSTRQKFQYSLKYIGKKVYIKVLLCYSSNSNCASCKYFEVPKILANFLPVERLFDSLTIECRGLTNAGN